RTSPTLPAAAAVVSEPRVAPVYTPEFQLNDSKMRGIVLRRRPPKIKALIGTPFGLSHCSSSDGHCVAATVKRAFGCAALRPQPGVHSCPCQSINFSGGVSVSPSHHTSPSGVSATLVKMQSRLSVAIALGLVFADVPGATPK